MTAKLGQLSEFSSMESQVWIEKNGTHGGCDCDVTSLVFLTTLITCKKICAYSLDYIGCNLTVYRAWVRWKMSCNKEEKERKIERKAQTGRVLLYRYDLLEEITDKRTG